MAIRQLSARQLDTMTAAEKDRWWLENVYQGNVPQMTVRVVVSGFLLGGLLSLTNLYVGAKTGWSLGVAITAVILSFATFKSLAGIGLCRDFHVLENNILQSIACSGGYINTPLFASMAAFMVVTDTVIPWWQMIIWLLGLMLLGVLFAIPLKRRFINEEQTPFPEGRACGVVLDSLHGEATKQSASPARLLILSGLAAGLIRLLQSHPLLEKCRLGFLSIPERVDAWYYRLAETRAWWVPSLSGIPLRELTIRPTLEIALIGAGGLMGIRTGVSLLIGAVINYVLLAPIMVGRGDIESSIDAAGVTHIGFTAITKWSLWCGVAMMTTGSLVAFFSKPGLFVSAFKALRGRKSARTDDCLRHIELPLWVFLCGVPIVGSFVVWIAHWFFGVELWMGALAIPMVFALTLIGVNSTALTSITPTGALGKISQLTYGAIAPGSITTNIATAGITAEVAFNASNAIQNMKPGYMLGGKPRLQALGHVIGALSGAIFSVAVFYPVFLRNNPSGLISESYPYPAVTIWRAVAEVLTRGLGQLPASALWAAIVGGSFGILLESASKYHKGKFPLSPVGIGLAFIIPFDICLAMFFGAFVFWLAGRWFPKPNQRMNRVLVQNQEPICAGIIAGASLNGVGVMAMELLVLGGH